MKRFVFQFKFQWSLFLRVQFTTPGIGLDNGLAPNGQQAIIWTNTDLIHWCIYAVLGEDELIYQPERYHFYQLRDTKIARDYDQMSQFFEKVWKTV